MSATISAEGPRRLRDHPAEALRQGATDLFASIAAWEAVRVCQVAGLGATVDIEVGAATDERVGPPIRLSGVVEALSDGRFEDPSPTHGGQRYYDAGPTALLDIDDGNKVALTTVAMSSYSPGQLTSLGLDLGGLKAIIAKGVNSPLAGYLPVIADHLFVDTPGCTAADLSLSYTRRRVPMLPFETGAGLVT